jgi:2,3-bisphosphoglycerate-dependent phosphoglycerate mutase
MIAIVMQANCEITKVVLVRNGESEWSKQNLFTGWTDVPLSNRGHEDAIRGGKLLRERGYKFDICYTSFLKRAIHTAIHLLDEIDQLYIPMFKSLHLNGRHYGALQGLNKKDITEKYGLEQVNKWRKSFSVPPPPLEEKDERNPANQEQYKNYQKNNLPLHESLKDTTERVVSFYNEIILPEIKSGKKVLITAHSNSLKALIKYLDDISEEEIVDLTIQSNNPLVYEFDYEYKPIKRYYLDDIQEDTWF